MKAPLYEQIYNHLLQRIKDGELKTGDRLPSENELADQFNVSRITTKKALETLAQKKLVERIRGKGSYVSNVLPDMEGALRDTGIAEPAAISPAGRTRLVGLILPEFAESYGSQLIHGVERGCAETNCRMLMKLTYDSREVEEDAIRSFLDLGVDGFIVFPVHGEHYNASLIRLVLDKFPVVLVDRYLKGIAACTVYSDNQASMSELTMHLLERGHREIGFISVPPDNTSTVEERIAGFSETLIRGGIVFRPQHTMLNLRSSLPRSPETANIQADIEAVRRFVELNPELTAFVAAEYNLALVLREALLGMNKRIPEDVEIVCFDSPPDPFGKPVFTHIRQNEYAMGRMAVDLLHGQWAGKDIGLNHVVPHAFVKGLSTK
ncbi:GntR family transcriptional regulator [Paenibacillus lycopersici]|uniref:GntR family transcriptional regulator n=1 Tax=Paenibacillus lycopersici TaxID=2704462 RepID=A0A6C0G4G9_9BACL|nr:GntR family transcriptional regulator [Paenibacillus lycopersici]QHT62374.1 GntR family transcriptional regulator [Paenibacillus lycopersici]